MTLKEFNQIPKETVFATGIIPNSPEGLYMTNGGGELRWVAKKGFGKDWAIYVHWSSNSQEYVENSGDKIYPVKSNLLKCVPDCEEIIPLYRK